MGQFAVGLRGRRPLPRRQVALVAALAAALSALSTPVALLAGLGTVSAGLLALAVSLGGAALLLTVGLAQIRRHYDQAQLKVSTLLNSVPEGVLEVDARGRIVFANAQVEELFGYAPGELLDQPIEILVPSRIRAGHEAHRSAFFSASRVRAMDSGLDISGQRKDGTEVAVDISLSKVASPQGPLMYCLIRDNRTRKAFESQLVESNRRLSSGVATLERNALELRRLSEMGELLHSSTTEGELHKIFAHTVEALFPRLSGALYALSDSRTSATIVCSWGREVGALRAQVAWEDCWALRRSRPHGSVLSGDEPRCSHYTDGVRRPSQCIPLLGHGELLGILHLFAADFADSEELSAPARLQFLHALANQMALSTANLRLRKSLQTQSLVDSLTGLYNRRVVDNWFERDVQAAAAAGRDASMLLLDIDHFKLFNDRFGHDCGDLVLRELGALLRRTLRSEDLVCRLGGEEFAALLPDTGPAAAENVGEKLRRAVEALVLERGGRSLGHMTVSVGVSSLGASGETAARLLRHADQALYQAKAAGRNRVVVYSAAPPPSAAPVLALPPRRA